MAERNKQVDNSDVVLKERLRRDFVAKADKSLCFDLFAGRGTFVSGIYQHEFERVVAVDKSAKQLAHIDAAPNCDILRGDNYKLLPRLMKQYGKPDFIDFDAYGDPRKQLQFALRHLVDRRLVLTATDGVWMARRRASATVASFGVDDCYWSELSCAWEDWPVVVLAQLDEWSNAVGVAVTEFRYIRPQRGAFVLYYGAVIERL